MMNHDLISAFGISHQGNFRSNNEDRILLRDLNGPPLAEVEEPVKLGGTFATGEKGFLALVCDGLGGGAFGEVASRTSAETIVDYLEGATKRLGMVSGADILSEAAVAAHERVQRLMVETPAFDGMGSTLSCLWFLGSKVHLVHVGDSRIYAWEGGRLEPVTVDQSPVGELKEQGRISDEEARRHPLKNYVNQVIGGNQVRVRPDSKSFVRRASRLWVLCSDGLTDSLSDEDLDFSLRSIAHLPTSEIAGRLLHQALSRAGRDNISVIVLREGRVNLLARLRGMGVARYRSWLRRNRRTPSSFTN